MKSETLYGTQRVTDPDLLKQAHSKAVQRTLPGTVIYVALFATVVLSTSYHERFPRLAAATAAALVVIGMWRMVMILTFNRWYAWHPNSWRILFSLATVSVGAVWSGFWAFAVLADGMVSATNLAVMATVGIAAAGVSTLAPSRSLTTAFLVLMMLPLALAMLIGGTAEQYAIALMLVAGLAFLISIGMRLHREYWTDLYHKQLVNERARELAEARDAAIRADRAKSEFLARMSHEIRTPMNGVMGMLELLRTTELTSRQRSFADNIQSSAKVLLTVIDEILDFSKIEAGKLRLENVAFDLEDAVEEAANLLAQHAAQKGLELVTDLPSRLVTHVRGDPVRFRQVLTNLLSNAVKFTPRGEVVIRVEQLEETEQISSVRIEVVDTGVGVNPQQHREIFSAFSQADGTTTRDHGGTGLGLAIVKQLTELMGGDVGLVSEPNRGSTFWFTARFEKQQTAPSPRFPHTRELAGLRVLVVDDNAVSRRVLDRQLRAWDMRPETVDSGERALEELSGRGADEQPYDLIIVDRDMPGMSGASLARRLRTGGASREAPIVMLSPLGHMVCCPDAAELGIAGCVTKPVSRRRLHREILNAINEHRLDEPGWRSTPAPGSDGAGPLNLRVLVAEDNAVNQIIAEEMLQIIGCVTTTVRSGKEAIEALRRAEFDAVLMDCRMPDMDGYEAAAIIRRHERQGGKGHHLPIIALTAHAGAGARERAIDAGMDEYLSKPFEMSDLRDVLERCVPGKQVV